MAYEIHLATSASQDLEKYVAYYSRESIRVAGIFVSELKAQIALLSNFPESGKKFSGNIRQLLMRRFPFWIYYKVGANDIVIFAIFHCSQNTREINRTIKRRVQ